MIKMSQGAKQAINFKALKKRYQILKVLYLLLLSVLLGVVIAGVLTNLINLTLGLLSGAIIAGLTYTFVSFRVSRAIEKGLKKYLKCDFYKSSNLRLMNITEGLCLQLGIELPKLVECGCEPYVAGAYRFGKKVIFFFSENLLNSLDRLELEAIVAQLCVRVDLGEVEKASFYISMKIGLSFLFLSSGKELMLSPEATYFADRDAVLTTRYPPALISALSKIENHNKNLKFSASKLDRLFLVPISKDAKAVVSTTERIDLLADW